MTTTTALPGQSGVPDNGVDDDCDGEVDESVDDIDGDGVSVADGDCDDDNGWMAPGLMEMCDGIDNNCDGVVDEGCDASVGGADAPAAGEKGGCSTVGERSTGLLWVWRCRAGSQATKTTSYGWTIDDCLLELAFPRTRGRDLNGVVREDSLQQQRDMNNGSGRGYQVQNGDSVAGRTHLGRPGCR